MCEKENTKYEKVVFLLSTKTHSEEILRLKFKMEVIRPWAWGSVILFSRKLNYTPPTPWARHFTFKFSSFKDPLCVLL